MDWYELTGKYHSQTFEHDCELSSLPEDWQRELAAVWRLEADVNNGAYIQFVVNWGPESHEYASRALKNMGASRMAEIVDTCQALIDEHFDFAKTPREKWDRLMPNRIVNPLMGFIKGSGSVLPRRVVKRIDELSYEFMDYPENIPELGLRYYRKFVVDEKSDSPNS